MAGNTGKMTAAALAARGPRMRLSEVKLDGQHVGLVVSREGEWCLRTPPVSRFRLGVYARSFSLRYLLNIGQGLRVPAQGGNV